MAVVGHAGAVEGQIFDGRVAIQQAGLHRHNQRGISGASTEPAEAIVLSGGYEDDLDLGEEIVYTGEGGRDPGSGRQIRDQTMTGGNSALANSHLGGSPVRVFRRTGVGNEYRYDGLFYVERYWPDRPASHGHLVWRYRLLKATADAESVVSPPPTPSGTPPRVPTTVQRIIRSTLVAQGVKEAHGNRCQVCGDRVELPLGKQYSEAAHIKPLGLPHNGPDVSSNVLCLCPTDHVRFDHGAIYIDQAGKVIDALSGASIALLRSTSGHDPDPTYLAHHRDRWTLI